jgi:hypothetical protein
MSLDPKYFVVLFKNKVLKKIIKKFSNSKNAKNFFEEKIKNSSSVIFEKKILAGVNTTLEIGLLGPKTTQSDYVYVTDELGRNIKVKFEDEITELIKIVIFKEEEKIYDIKKKNKIKKHAILLKFFKTIN